ncbi:hypothetical protein RB195_021131 [Necator americanus]|uniref:Uncharacterized protein n=1 Tax=Necator americanus TaxID=51031 RepID=A0ABR1EC70_NECAM
MLVRSVRRAENRGSVRNAVLRASAHLLHDNVRLYIAKETHKKIEKLASLLKAFLAKKILTKFDDINRTVIDFFDTQPPHFFEKGMVDLPVRWSTVVTNDGYCTVD